ncbi:MAG: S-layer homology domain-containing protein [Chloroflexi bacterium]|nr:S-layer homology domain-containing protein [Chloroflexota bacterium]
MRRKVITIAIILGALASIGLAAMASTYPTAAAVPAQMPARYGTGGKISLPPAPDGSQNLQGPVDFRSIASKLAPGVLPVFGTDINLSGGNETTIASNPANPLNFLAGANNVGRFTTTDGGQTWNIGTLSGGGDPAVAFGPTGVAYFAELGNTSTCPDAARVWKSTDGGLTFGPYVNAISDPSPTDHFIDKEWLTTDKSPTSPYSGRLYITASSFHTPPGCDLSNYIDNREVLAYSTDQGATFTGPIDISDASHNQDQFTNPVAASDGTLYVSYQYQNCTYNCNGQPAYQMLAKSTNGGVSFSPSITITGQPISYTGASVAGYQYLYAGSTNSGFRHNDQAIIGVSPTNPNELYALWSDGRFESTFVYQGVTGWHGDIVFTRSTDGGNTWTTPIKINDDNVQGKDQFFPWLTVGSDGTLHASWMDRRDAPVNGFQYREYYSQSTDGGLTWSPNQAVADVGSTPSSFIGDYSGIAVNNDNSRVLPIWTDQRSGQRAYTDVGRMIGGATATTTSVPSATSTSVATSTPGVTGTPTCVPTGGTLGPWSYVSPYPASLESAAITTDGTYAYGMGGAVNFTPTDLVTRYDPTTDTWTTLAPLPTALYDTRTAYAANTGKIYAFGGIDSSGNVVNTTYIYDIASNSWSAGANMPDGRFFPSVSYSAGTGKIYIIGGLDSNYVETTQTWEYDPLTNTFATNRAPIPTGMGGSATTIVGQFIYLMGSFNGSATTLNYRYDIVSDTWTTRAPLPDARYDAQAGAYGGQIYLWAGGNPSANDPAHLKGSNTPDLPTAFNTTFVYDIASDSWTNGPNLNTTRAFSGGTAIGNRMLAVAGFDGSTGDVASVESALVSGGGCPTSTATTVPTATSTTQATNTTQATSTTGATETSTTGPTSTPGGATETATTEATSTTEATATFAPSPTACTISFSDVPPSNTFYASIECLACKGIVSGYDDGTFRPNNQVTRGQIAKIVSNSVGYTDDPGTQIYTDVPPSNPFYAYINRLTQRGYMGGYPCGSIPQEPCDMENRPYFRPGAQATRGQISKIISNAAGIQEDPGPQIYTDVPPGNPFYDYINRLTRRGVMGGYACGSIPQEPCDTENRPYFRWGNNTTRGQAAKIDANTFFPNCLTTP